MINSQVLKEKLLELCQKIYPHRMANEAISLGENVGKIIDFAKSNRLASYFALEYHDLFKDDKKLSDVCQKLILEYNGYKEKIKEAIKIVKEVLVEEPFIVIKTFSSYPHLTSDLDIIVKDSRITQKLAERILKNNAKLPIEIDIGDKISWTRAEEVSRRFIWNNSQKYNFDNTDFLIPNPQLDVLIRITHLPFELAEIKLGELLHIYRFASQVNWKILENEAKLMGWPKTFKKMTEILDFLHYSLFQLPFVGKSKKIRSKQNIQFPFHLPFTLLIQAVIEKKAFGKIYGGRYIIKDRILTWIKRNII